MATIARQAAGPVPADPVSAGRKEVLRTLKLGRLPHTPPERLTLGRQQNLPHPDFLHVVLADEVTTRRDTNSAALRARAAGLDGKRRADRQAQLGELEAESSPPRDTATDSASGRKMNSVAVRAALHRSGCRRPDRAVRSSDGPACRGLSVARS